MSGHDFEKQVRQKLHDLKMTPSAGAWENIEQNLRERKRRFAPVLWLPLLLLGLAAGGYFLFTSDDEKELVAAGATPTGVTPKQATPAEAHDNTTKPNVSGGISDAPTDEEKIYSPEKSATTAPPESVTQKEEKPPGVEGIRETVHPAPPLLAIDKKENEIAGHQSTGELNSFNKVPSLNLLNEKSKISAPTLPINSTSPAKPAAQKKQSSRWSWGLSGVAGVSSVSEGDFLNFNRAQVEDVATVAFFAPQPPYQPSSISPGFTYSAGAFVKRDLSKKFSLSAGLNYLQLNTRNKVGSRIDARQVVNNGSRGYMFVSSYYSLQQDQPSEYRNRYHFVEVPVELHTRVNKSEKVQIHVNTGFAISRLLKSNSLHFDGTTGVYYKNDKLLNRTQVAAKAGFSLGLLNQTTRPLWIGPYARYNISRILQKDVSASKSFASVGLDVKLFIR